MITIKSTKYSKYDIGFCTDVLYNGLRQSCVFYDDEKRVFDNDFCSNCHCKLACTELKSAYHHILSKKLRAEAAEQYDGIMVESVDLLDS